MSGLPKEAEDLVEPVSLMEYLSVTKYKSFQKEINNSWSVKITRALLVLSIFMLTVYALPQVFDFTIAEDDVEVLNGLHDGRRVSWDPSLVV